MEWLEIFDISLFRSVLRSMTPIALIGFGAAMCSASGVLNIGLEGKMLNAAFIGVAASYYSGSALTGFIAGVSAGVLTAILFGVLSFNLGADEVLAGLAINIFAIAFTRYLLETLFDRRGFFSDPSIQGIDPIEIEFLKDTIKKLGYKDVSTARASVSRIRKSGRSHAHKIQAAVSMEQRAKAAGKSKEAAVFRRYINANKKGKK